MNDDPQKILPFSANGSRGSGQSMKQSQKSEETRNYGQQLLPQYTDKLQVSQQLQQPIEQNTPQKQNSAANNQATEEQIQSSKEMIKHKLKVVFTYFCSIGDRTNVNLLKSNKLRKLAMEANLLDKQISLTYLDLIYTQFTQGKTQMDFQNFCALIARIAVDKFPEMPPQHALLNLIQNHLQGLFDSHVNQSELGRDLSYFNTPMDEDCLIVFKSLSSILRRIHKMYFTWEPSSSAPGESLNVNKNLATNLLGFLKEFEIFPNLISKPVAMLLLEFLIAEQEIILISPKKEYQQMTPSKYNQSLSSPSKSPSKHEGVTSGLTFNKMIRFLFITSEIAFNKVLESLQSQFRKPLQRLISLLERMELSKGFLLFQQKTHSTHTSAISLLIPQETLKEILNRNQDLHPADLGCQLAATESPSKSKQQDQSYSKSPVKSFQQQQIAENLSINPEAQEVFNHFHKELHYAFVAFCQIGDPGNITSMKTSKLMKLLRNAGLIKKKLLSQSSDNKTQPSPDKPVLSDPKNPQPNGASENYIDENLVDCMVARLIGPNALRTSAGKNSENKTHSFDETSERQSKARGKIEYSHFLKILEDISKELYPESNLQDAVAQIVNENILKAQLQDKRYVNKKTTADFIDLHNLISDDKDMVTMMEEIHGPLSSYFKEYCSLKTGNMNLNQFLHFCRDFEIFPHQISKSQLQYVFSALAYIQKSQREEEKNNLQTSMGRLTDDGENDQLNSAFFIESLVMCAVEIYTIEDNALYRVLLLLERMNNSNGPKIVQTSLGNTGSSNSQWDLLNGLRQKYHTFYDTKMIMKQKNNNKENQEMSFDNLLDMGLHQSQSES